MDLALSGILFQFSSGLIYQNGKRVCPDLTHESLAQLGNIVLTRRLVLGIANGQFDLLGVVMPLLIKLKAGVRDLFIKD